MNSPVKNLKTVNEKFDFIHATIGWCADMRIRPYVSYCGKTKYFRFDTSDGEIKFTFDEDTSEFIWEFGRRTFDDVFVRTELIKMVICAMNRKKIAEIQAVLENMMAFGPTIRSMVYHSMKNKDAFVD